MFFLGLAGSFMPYLLFLGVLFVLTLGTNMDSDPETAAITEKTIEYKSPDKQEYSPHKTCYFFNPEQIKQTDQQKNNQALADIFEFIECQSPGKLKLYQAHQKYNFEVYRTFFGLSPPSLIS